MATIPYTLSGGTPPYTISVKKLNEGFERYISYNGSNLDFQPATDNVMATYNITLLMLMGVLEMIILIFNVDQVVGVV